MFKNYSKRKILNQYNTIVEKQQELYFLQNVTILGFFLILPGVINYETKI